MSVYGRAHEHGVPAHAGNASVKKQQVDDDDWDTDPDYVNDLPEKETRWGSKEIVPPKKTGTDIGTIHDIAKRAQEQDQQLVMNTYLEKKAKSLYGGQKDE